MFVLKKTYEAMVADNQALRTALFESEQSRIRWQGEANEANAKFKQAVADLEKNDVEIAELKADLAASRDQVAELLPDALAMRRKRKMDRDRKKGKGL